MSFIHLEDVAVLKCKKRGNSLSVKIGADDPDTLYDSKFMSELKRAVSSKGYKRVRGASTARVYGQNRLSTRTFYYEKGER